MKTFRIIENYDDGVDYEELKRDYLDENISVSALCKKHGLSKKRYNTYRKSLIKDTGVARKPSKHIWRKMNDIQA